MYELRKTTSQDIMQVMAIIDEGKSYLKSCNVNQWQNGYPNVEAIIADIDNGYGYVLTVANRIVATVALSFDGEPWYDDIRSGQWLSNDDFLVIHRMAVKAEHRGSEVATEMLNQIAQLCLANNVYSIKIDTHADNLSMQKLVAKNGFQHCGVVILGSEGERLAYEKRLDK